MKSLNEWIEYTQTLTSNEIELGLDRVSQVYVRLFKEGIKFKVVTVAGTNGKGSTSELLSSIYHASAHSVGKFTSPHLVNFNERFIVNTQEVSDGVLVAAFEKIEKARKEVPLSFFEFCTLIAIVVFAEQKVDIAIMEVGLGGRLDSVNILDADIAVITSISIDHTDWLGDSIEKIAYEKVGVTRPHKPCVVGIEQAPESIIDYCNTNKTPLYLLNTDFHKQLNSDTWQWCNEAVLYAQLPFPFMQNNVQLDNASVAIQVIELLQADLAVHETDLKKGLKNATLAGRCQVVSELPTIIFDVSHNEDSVSCLAEFVKKQKIKGKVVAVCGMLKDKQVEASFTSMVGLVDEWHFASIHHQRGLTAMQLKQKVEALELASKRALVSYAVYDEAAQAYDAVRAMLKQCDCLIVFGSFFIVSDIIKHTQTVDE